MSSPELPPLLMRHRLGAKALGMLAGAAMATAFTLAPTAEANSHHAKPPHRHHHVQAPAPDITGGVEAPVPIAPDNTPGGVEAPPPAGPEGGVTAP